MIKYGLLLPVTGLLILSANARVVAEVAETTFSVVAAEDEGISMTEEFGKQEPQTKERLIKGKVTDENGEYQMKVPETGILYFSYVGKKTEVAPYTKGVESLNVTLKKTNTPLEDVVIIGYMAKNSKKTDKNTFLLWNKILSLLGGGSCQQFIAKNIKYPEEAMKKGIEGTVYVTFTIDEQGKVVQPKVLKGVNELLDNEALRVVSSMPDWKPGKQREQAVEVQYTVPVQFHITKDDKEAKDGVIIIQTQEK